MTDERVTPSLPEPAVVEHPQPPRRDRLADLVRWIGDRSIDLERRIDVVVQKRRARPS